MPGISGNGATPKLGKRAAAPELVKGSFNQHAIKWNEDKTFFSFNVQLPGQDEGHAHFYGWWRKSRVQSKIRGGQELVEPVWCIDLFVQFQDHEYGIDSITYFERDPRINIGSLNADICAATNKWFFTRLNGNCKTLTDLEHAVKHPTVYVRRIETIDRMIARLQEFRNVAITSGGTRLCELRGDKEGSAPVLVNIDVTPQAVALKGKLPSSYTAVAIDAAVNGERPTARSVAISSANSTKADPATLKAMVERLKHTTDKSEARKLRGILRKMGHRGGTRSE